MGYHHRNERRFMSLNPDFTQYVNPSVQGRTIIIGADARKQIPTGAIEQDQGGFRPHFLMWAREQWLRANPGHNLTIKIDFHSLTRPGAKENFDLRGVTGSAMWPAMGSRKIVEANIYIDGELQPWGEFFSILGLGFTPGNKGFKRLNEITRPSRIWSDSGARIKFIHPDEREALGLDEKEVDGCVIISKSFAITCAKNILDYGERFTTIRRIRSGEIVRIDTFRMQTEWGLIKGHAIVVDDRTLRAHHGEEVDVVTDMTNLKRELFFTIPRTFTTFEPLSHPTGEVNHDYQTKSWMKNFLDNASIVRAQMTVMLNETLDAIKNGEMPDWTMFKPDFYLRAKPKVDPWGDERNPHEGEVLARNWLRISAAGIDIRSSATIISLMARGVINSLNARLSPAKPTADDPNPDPGRDAQLWAPAPWAVRGYIITRELLIHLAGIDLPGDDETVIYHAETASVVIPGKLFIENYDNHGGYDQDDAVLVFLRQKADGSGLTGIFVRQPNSDGEYSEMPIAAFTFPWQNTQLDIPTLDEEYRRPRITDRGETADKPLPEALWVWGEEYREIDAREAIEVAFLILGMGGVGGYMNALMCAADMGLDLELHASPEQVVDVCQASPYREFAEWHETAVNDIWKQIIASTAKLDRLLWCVKPSLNQRNGITTRQGHFWQIYSHGIEELKRFTKESRNLGFQLRARYRLQITDLVNFSEREMRIATQAVRFYRELEPLLAREAEMNQSNGTEAESPYRRTSGLVARKLIKTLTHENDTIDNETLHNVLLCMYKVIITPDKDHPYGSGDNILFGPPPDGQIGMLDLMLEALAAVGEAKQVHILKSGFYSNPELLDRIKMEAGVKRGLTEEFSLFIGDDGPEAMQKILAIWAQSTADTEAMEAIRLLGVGTYAEEGALQDA